LTTSLPLSFFSDGTEKKDGGYDIYLERKQKKYFLLKLIFVAPAYS